jgi:UDP-N-acetylmuramoyl-tripeptide--D-alanyl-D-alanine ligase
VQLGSKFLVTHQRPPGNFDYLYDWKTKQYAKDDNDVRQAGALWGLALLAQVDPAITAQPGLRPALEKGLRFWDDRARTTSTGGRFPVYPFPTEADEADTGGIGTASLVTLAVIDYVRGLPPEEKDTIAAWRAKADAYIAFLVASRDREGLWRGSYRYDGGTAIGKRSPYSDGEGLLALTKAMKYLDREDLLPIVKQAAEAGYRINVQDALKADADSDTTKGFYQWSSMAYYELATSRWAGDFPYGEWLFRLADWMLDVHRVLERPRNTGYAYEGLVSAYAWAKQVNDGRAPRYACAIQRGLSGLLAWQIGHPRASALGPADDPAALGGVQNHKAEPALRIDVVQHQMHATTLALEHLVSRRQLDGKDSGGELRP